MVVIIIALVIIFLSLWRLSPINTNDSFLIFSVIVLGTGGSLFWLVRMTGFTVICEGCNIDIFPFLESGKATNVSVRFCPHCGNKIEPYKSPEPTRERIVALRGQYQGRAARLNG